MNEMGESAHAFSSRGREGIAISGVLDVISFDDRGILTETLCGSMAIEGEGLHITVLNITEGKVTVEGKISAVYYFEDRPKQKKGLFGRKE